MSQKDLDTTKNYITTRITTTLQSERGKKKITVETKHEL